MQSHGRTDIIIIHAPMRDCTCTCRHAYSRTHIHTHVDARNAYTNLYKNSDA